MSAIRVSEASGSAGVVQATDGFGNFVPTNLLFNTGSTGLAGSVSLGRDVATFISGSTNTKDSTVPGVTLFGGDVHISGNLTTNKELVFNEKLTGTVDGTNTYFTLANTPFSTSEISIFVNGQLQTPPDLTTWQDYSATGSNIYFTTSSTPPEDSILLAIYNKVAS